MAAPSRHSLPVRSQPPSRARADATASRISAAYRRQTDCHLSLVRVSRPTDTMTPKPLSRKARGFVYSGFIGPRRSGRIGVRPL